MMRIKNVWHRMLAFGLSFVVLLGQSVLAQRIYLDNKDLVIDGSHPVYELMRKDSDDEDGQSRIIVQDGVKAVLHLHELLLVQKNPLQIGRGAQVELVLHGNNFLGASQGSALSFHEGALKISGEGSLLLANMEAGNAVIGSAKAKAMRGRIQIGGRSSVMMHIGVETTGIGAGKGGAMEGTIHLTGDSVLVASLLLKDLENPDQAPLAMERLGQIVGAGKNASMSGEIRVDQRAQVLGVQDHIEEGPAPVLGNVLGAADPGHMTGRIRIVDQAQVYTWVGNTNAIDEKPRTGARVLTPRQQIEATIDGIKAMGLSQRLIIGGGQVFTSADPAGSYEIAATASINGVSSAEAQAFIDGKLVNIYLSPEGKAVNYSNGLLVKSPPPSFEVTGLKRVATPDHQITAGPVVGTVKAIRKKAASPELFDLAGKELLVLSSLAFEGQHPGNAFTLSFHLGPAHAGKRIEVQTIENGRRDSRIVEANGQGILSFPVQALGSYALTLVKP